MLSITVLALFGAVIAAHDDPSLRIVGGSDTRIEDYPYMVNVLLASDGWGTQLTPVCGGSLITCTSVLTAAHCLVDNINELHFWRVRLGSTYASTGNDIHTVRELVVHPEYETGNVTYNHDVAIMKLATSAVLSKVVQIARIAGTNYLVPDDATVTAIGWGSLAWGGMTAEILQRVDIKRINQERCRARYATVESIITPGMLCAGIFDIGGKDTCGRDSGGPLLHQGVVVGITSWGLQCGHHYFPGVYVNVPYYTNWIVSNA